MLLQVRQQGEVFFRPPSHFLTIRAVTGVIFGARLLGRCFASEALWFLVIEKEIGFVG